MPKDDYAKTAHKVFEASIGKKPKRKPPEREKDPAAVELGSKGGKARAEKLTEKQRKAQAKKAAKVRWKK